MKILRDHARSVEDSLLQWGMRWFLRSLAAASSLALLAAPTCFAPTAGDVRASRWQFASGDASRRAASTTDADREIGRVADPVGGGVEASPSIDDDWRSAVVLDLTLERVLGDEEPEAARLQAMWGSKRLYWEGVDGRFFLDDEIEVEPRGGSGWAPFDVGRAIKSAIGHAIVGVLEEALADEEADDPSWAEIDHRRFSATADGEVIAIVDLPTPKRVEAELQDLASAALAWRGANNGAPKIAIECGSLDPAAIRLSFESHRPFSNLREGQFLGRLSVFGAPSLSSRSWKAEERRMPFMVALTEALDCPFPPYRAVELTLVSSVPGEAELLTAVPAWLISHPEVDESERLRGGRGSWARAVVEGGDAILSVVKGGQLFEAQGLVPIAWLPDQEGRSVLLARQATATLLLGQYLLVEATSEGLRVEPLAGIDARVFEFDGIRRDDEAGPLLEFIDERPPLSDRETRWIRIPLADVHRTLS